VLVMAAELLDMEFPDHICVERVAAHDTPDYDIQAHFFATNCALDGVRRMHEEGQEVCILVHCYAGISRSVTAVVAYLMTHLNFSTSEALQLVQSRRKGALPNLGFMVQLGQLELRIREASNQGNDSRGLGDHLQPPA
jgi:protein-tyrosine phosphatase